MVTPLLLVLLQFPKQLDFNSQLNVAGITTFENTTDQNITNVSYGADGAVRIDGGVGFDK